VLVLLVAIPAAYGLARTTGYLPTLGLGLLIVLQMMPQTATVIPLFQIFGNWALLDKTLGVVFADTALLIPFATLLLRPFFRSVPHELEEAASIDGASVLRTFFSIVLPLSWLLMPRGTRWRVFMIDGELFLLRLLESGLYRAAAGFNRMQLRLRDVDS